MKRCAQLAVFALLIAGLATTTGCDDPAEEESPEDQQEVEQPVAQEDEADEDEPEYEEPEVDEDMYVRAAYESRCVDQEIEDEDEAAEIREEIFARYGFDEDSFEAAGEELDDQEAIELQVTTRMERCDEETARGFADEGSGEFDESEEDGEDEADDEEAEEEAGEQAQAAPAPEPSPEPAMTGTINATISGSDFEDTNLELRIRRDFAVSGQLRGTREGNSFVIPISGEVSEGNSITASGDRGGHNVEIDGRLSESGAEGRLTGEVNQRNFRLQYTAR